MRIVFATIGSLGDLHPVIAFALGLRERGHRVEIATTAIYRDKITALGLTFHALRPDLLGAGEHIISSIMDGPRGTERGFHAGGDGDGEGHRALRDDDL